jgi:hypothetical protein
MLVNRNSECVYRLQQCSATGIPPQGIRCVTSYGVCRHKASGVSQGMGCAATRRQVCHKVWGVPPQCIRCVTRYGVCRNNVSSVSSQPTACAATKHQVCHKLMGCAATMYQVCHHRVLRVPPQGIRCITSYGVCRHKASGVSQVRGCAATRHQVCHKVWGVPPQGIRCVITGYCVCRHKVSGVPRIFVRNSIFSGYSYER